MEKKPRWRKEREADWEVKIKGYEAAVRPKSRSRKRHSPSSTSRNTVGEREKEDSTSCVEKQKKKERNYKEEGNIYSEEDETVEKSGGREKKIGRGGSGRKE